MSRYTCSIVAVAFATGLMWGCDGLDIMSPSTDTKNPVSKMAVQQMSTSHAEVVFTLTRDGKPVIGAATAFTRHPKEVSDPGESVSGSLTDQNGQVALLLLSKEVSGDYQVRAWEGDDQIGSWSFPVQAGYKVVVDLPIGGNALVTETSPVTPIPIGPVPSGSGAATSGSGPSD